MLLFAVAFAGQADRAGGERRAGLGTVTTRQTGSSATSSGIDTRTQMEHCIWARRELGLILKWTFDDWWLVSRSSLCGYGFVVMSHMYPLLTYTRSRSYARNRTRASGRGNVPARRAPRRRAGSDGCCPGRPARPARSIARAPVVEASIVSLPHSLVVTNTSLFSPFSNEQTVPSSSLPLHIAELVLSLPLSSKLLEA